LISNFFLIKNTGKKILGMVFSLIICISIITLGPINIFYAMSVWKVESFLYENKIRQIKQ